MSETKPRYDYMQAPQISEAVEAALRGTNGVSCTPTGTPGAIYNADGQVKNLLNIASVNDERGTGALISGFLLLHKDLDRIATALEMRNRADTADRPLSRRLRAVNGGAKP